MPQFKVRRYAADDLPTFMRFAYDFCELIGKKLHEPTIKDHIERVHREGLILVAELEGKVVGVIGAMETRNHFTGARVMYRTDIFVDKAFHNKGVALTLIRHLKKVGKLVGIEEFDWELNKHLKRK